jgi:hypothetical protein
LLSCWYLAWLIILPRRWRRFSCDTSLDFQWTTWCNIPDDSALRIKAVSFRNVEKSDEIVLSH